MFGHGLFVFDCCGCIFVVLVPVVVNEKKVNRIRKVSVGCLPGVGDCFVAHVNQSEGLLRGQGSFTDECLLYQNFAYALIMCLPSNYWSVLLASMACHK